MGACMSALPQQQSSRFEDARTDQQIRDFANTLDAVSLILKAIGFRVHKLRDVIDALQGVAGGRMEFECSHRTLAHRLEHTGEDQAAETYAARKVAALEKEQQRVGRLLFGIERGGGFERRRTRYINYLTRAANYAMQRARGSIAWKDHPGKALAAQIAAAVEMLPLASQPSEEGRDSMPIDDALYIQRMLKQSINCALKAMERAARNGGDDLALAESVAERLLRYARDQHARSASTVEQSEGEPLHFCGGSDNLSRIRI